MPNNSYKRSACRERYHVNSYRADGWISARSAGSKSPVDVWAFGPISKAVDLIQCKTSKGHTKYKLSLIRETTGVTVREYLETPIKTRSK